MSRQILIAGVSSGVGKTTITMGLVAALARRGLVVQPFKCGPDYIDPTYHTLAAGRPCRNIDTWMVPPARMLSLFRRAAAPADLVVVEGVMGIFDGFSYTDEEGSTAQIAKLIGAPVLLVLDVGKMARSAGALAQGYTRFDPDLHIAGFILNRCGSESHYQGVKEAVEQATGRPVVGWLPKDAVLHIPERHLGLVPTDERGELTAFISAAADLIEKYFDLEQILALATPLLTPASSPSDELSTIQPSFLSSLQPSIPLIAVARDPAFSFYYEDNLDLLRENNVEITFFSPQHDTSLPAGTAGLYLGGGFPEVYAASLAANKPMHEAIRQAHAAGMPIYAECGGFMLLTQAIIDLDGHRHPMVGLVPGITRMQPRLISLGYRLVESPGGNFMLPAGVTTRGHEFHWSTWEFDHGEPGNPAALSPAWRIRPRVGLVDYELSGYANKNLVASYVHLHFAHDEQLAGNFVAACRAWKDGK